MPQIKIEPLTKAAFAPFGEVVEMAGAHVFSINEGFAQRCNELATIDVSAQGGSPNIGIFVASPRVYPLTINLMERHPLGSQMFYPLQDRPWLVMVCADPRDAASYRAFSATGHQGVNYTRNIWHHTLLVFDPDSRFLIVDRSGPGNNLEEFMLEKNHGIHLAPSAA